MTLLSTIDPPPPDSDQSPSSHVLHPAPDHEMASVEDPPGEDPLPFQHVDSLALDAGV
jgi:hypothetical protein